MPACRDHTLLSSRAGWPLLDLYMQRAAQNSKPRPLPTSNPAISKMPLWAIASTIKMPQKPSIAALPLIFSAHRTKPKRARGVSGVRGGSVTPCGSWDARTATLRDLDTAGRGSTVFWLVMHRVLVLGCAVRRWLHARLAIFDWCSGCVVVVLLRCGEEQSLRLWLMVLCGGCSSSSDKRRQDKRHKV